MGAGGCFRVWGSVLRRVYSGGPVGTKLPVSRLSVEFYTITADQSSADL